LKEKSKFCAKCGATVSAAEAAPAKAAKVAKAVKGAKKAEAAPAAVVRAAPVAPPAAQLAIAPAPAAKTISVSNIVRKPSVVVSLQETMDFTAAEKELDSGLKAKAFAGFFSSPPLNEVRVDSLTKIYEPVNAVRAVYEGTFEVMKEFTLNLDPGTTKLSLEGKSYDIKEVASGGTSLKLTGAETITKRVEKGVYYDMKGVQKNQLEAIIKGKPTLPFNPAKAAGPRVQVFMSSFDSSGLTDRVLTPDLVQRVNNAKKTVDEKVTVEILTVYCPKYKATVTSLKNNQQKVLIFSAVDKQVFPTETF
jgi:hypothetical protein